MGKVILYLFLTAFWSGFNVLAEDSSVVYTGEDTTVDQHSSQIKAFDKLFSAFNEELPHVHVKLYTNENGAWKGESIPQEMLDQFSIKMKAGFAFEKINLNDHLTGYLIGDSAVHTIQLCVYDKTQQKFIEMFEVARYEKMKGTYEKVTNSWIKDLNNDDNLDIATWVRVYDFEFETEISSKFCPDVRFILYLKNDEFEYARWNKGVLDMMIMRD